MGIPEDALALAAEAFNVLPVVIETVWGSTTQWNQTEALFKDRFQARNRLSRRKPFFYQSEHKVPFIIQRSRVATSTQ